MWRIKQRESSSLTTEEIICLIPESKEPERRENLQIKSRNAKEMLTEVRVSGQAMLMLMSWFCGNELEGQGIDL